MTIEDAVYSHLSTYAGLVALIETRVYQNLFPDKVTHPAVKFQRIDTQREYTHQGEAGLARPLFQFEAYATTPEAAKAVIDQVRYALRGYNQLMGGESGVLVQGAIVEDERSGYESDTRLFRCDVDVKIPHEET